MDVWEIMEDVRAIKRLGWQGLSNWCFGDLGTSYKACVLTSVSVTDHTHPGAGWRLLCVSVLWHISGELAVPPPSPSSVRAPGDRGSC